MAVNSMQDWVDTDDEWEPDEQEPETVDSRGLVTPPHRNRWFVGFRWIAEGWRLFRQAPGLWLAGWLAYFLLTVLIWHLPLTLRFSADLEINFSASLQFLTLPLCLAGFLHGASELAQGRPLDWRCFIAGFRLRPKRLSLQGLIFIGGLFLSALSVGVAGLLLDLLLTELGALDPFNRLLQTILPQAHINTEAALAVVGILASFLLVLPVLLLLWVINGFAVTLLLQQDLSIWQSVRRAFHGGLRNFWPLQILVLVFCLILLILLPIVIPALLQLVIWLLHSMPKVLDLVLSLLFIVAYLLGGVLWLIALVLPIYPAYRDIFLAKPGD